MSMLSLSIADLAPCFLPQKGPLECALLYPAPWGHKYRPSSPALPLAHRTTQAQSSIATPPAGPRIVIPGEVIVEQPLISNRLKPSASTDSSLGGGENTALILFQRETLSKWQFLTMAGSRGMTRPSLVDIMPEAIFSSCGASSAMIGRNTMRYLVDRKSTR